METFAFAGFTFPRAVAMLPKGKPAARLATIRKSPVPFKVAARSSLSTYQTAPKPGGTGGAFFYLESDFAPGLRWRYADETDARINHNGWFSDPYGDGETIRGIVVRLPRGRGFLPGWSMGTGMASAVETSSRYDDETGAAYAADSMAERVAEKEREYQSASEAGRRFAELGEEVAESRRAALAILRDRKTASGSAALCDVIRDKVESLLSEIRVARAKREALKEGDGDEYMSFWPGEARLRDAFNESAGSLVIA